MKNAEEKLRLFSETVLSETGQKADELISGAQNESAKIILEASEKYYTQAQQRISDGKSAIHSGYVRKEAAEKAQAQKDILSHRMELVGSIFSAVEERLKRFAQSQEYGDYLRGLIAKCRESGPDISGEIRLSPADFERRDLLLANSAKSFTVSEDDTLTLGGLKIRPEGKSIVYDHSFDTALEAQKETFVSSFDMRLDNQEYQGQ